MVATKPLIYRASVTDDFYLTFKDGRITNYYAVKELEVLQKLTETDEGSYYLGEIALVSNKSPLSQTDTLFYNTLFDQSTACHIGIGNASPSNIQNSSNLSEEELKAMGLNTSLLLVNVTLGTEDMKVVGIQEGGTEVLLMNNSNFVTPKNRGNCFRRGVAPRRINTFSKFLIEDTEQHSCNE